MVILFFNGCYKIELKYYTKFVQIKRDTSLFSAFRLGVKNGTTLEIHFYFNVL